MTCINFEEEYTVFLANILQITEYSVFCRIFSLGRIFRILSV